MSGRPSALVPRSVAERKPPHGAPCNGCGLCCRVTLCDLAQHVFYRPAVPGPCPALVLDEGGKSSCGLATVGTPERRDAAAVLIRAGEGCDCRINGEPIDRAFHAYQDEQDVVNADKRRAARAAWDMPKREEIAR